MESDTSGREWHRASSYRRRTGRRRKRVKSWSERIGDCTRNFIAFLFSNVGVCVLVVGYTVGGAFLFNGIEGSVNSNATTNVSVIRDNVAFRLWKLTAEENVFSETTWKVKVDAELENYQQEIARAIKNGYGGADALDVNMQWSFAGAFLYSLTVITTIGYGNSVPRTKWGKVATILYAIFGMPLFLLYLTNIGDILARSFKWTYARCCLCRCRKRQRNFAPPRDSDFRRAQCQMVNFHGGEVESSSINEGNDERVDDDGNEGEGEGEEDEDDDSDNDSQSVTVPLTLCFAIMIGYVCGGAILFAKWEDWDFLDGSYFCFISLSTIGFGDIVPGDKIYSGQGLELSFVFCSMYLMLGMSIISALFNLMQQEVIAKMRTFVRTVKHILRCDR